MSQDFHMRTIARVRSDFSSKFGVPRQSGLVDALEAAVVFEPEYRNAAALRGLEGFSHVWLVWVFDQAVREGGEKSWSPTVRPPRLGGNARLGVFATRSPFRPNPIALSAVALTGIEETADLVPEALGGFAAAPPDREALTVEFPPELLERVPPERREALRGVLALDPRPRYQEDPRRVYGFCFAGLEVKFSVEGTVLRVRDVEEEG